MRRRSSQRGFTIIELMIVMMLMGLMLGMGAGVYLGLGDSLRYRTAIGSVKTAIRKTRNFAVSGGGPAVVRFDLKNGVVRGSGNLPVGLWHFEDEVGAFGRDARFVGGEIGPQGRFGRGVHFTTGGWAELGKSAEFDDREGMLVELWVKPLEVGNSVLVRKGSAYELATDDQGRLTGTIEVDGTEVSLEAKNDDPIPKGRWTRVGLLYDRYRFQLLRDGRAVASVEESRPLMTDRGAPLTIGASGRPFQGSIDEVRVFRIVPGEPVELPQGMSFDGEGSPRIVYRAGGSLDPEVHKGPVTVRVRHGDEVEELTIGILGMIL